MQNGLNMCNATIVNVRNIVNYERSFRLPPMSDLTAIPRNIKDNSCKFHDHGGLNCDDRILVLNNDHAYNQFFVYQIEINEH